MLPLNNYLPYLINRIGPPIEAGFAGALAKAGITLQMWRVLAVLFEYGDQTVGRLSHLTSIPISTLSRLISRMAKKGLVSRRRDGEDARSVTVHLLKPGAGKAEMLIPHAAAYERELTRSFTEAELATFKQLLVKFYDGLMDESETEEDRLAG
jgi:DNA-binding MarR family transcriptional regulator